MAGPAYPSTVKIDGTSTAFTGEACTLVSGTTYQINTSARRLLDPAVAVTVKDGGTPIAAADVTIDYLFGNVTLASAPGGAVTVDASYLPTVTIAMVTDFSISASATMLVTTNLDSAGGAERMMGLKDFTAQITALSSPFYDHGGTQELATLFNAGTPILLEVRPTGDGKYFRGWAVIESLEEKGTVDGLMELAISLTGAARTGSGQTEGAAFGWGT